LGYEQWNIIILRVQASSAAGLKIRGKDAVRDNASFVDDRAIKRSDGRSIVRRGRHRHQRSRKGHPTYTLD
jgi:hypothetical protein